MLPIATSATITSGERSFDAVIVRLDKYVIVWENDDLEKVQNITQIEIGREIMQNEHIDDINDDE